jgi:hypothetical protein
MQTEPGFDFFKNPPNRRAIPQRMYDDPNNGTSLLKTLAFQLLKHFEGLLANLGIVAVRGDIRLLDGTPNLPQ